MKIGDICRVVSQPPNMIVTIVGKVGFISEIKDNYVSFESLKIDGSIDGAGTIPLSCLRAESDPVWLHAKELRDQYIAKILEEGLERGRRWQSKLLEVAEKYSLTVKQVEDLYQELVSYRDEI
jgi:predicted RNA-binding protein with RPS1 domain